MQKCGLGHIFTQRHSPITILDVQYFNCVYTLVWLNFHHLLNKTTSIKTIQTQTLLMVIVKFNLRVIPH